MKKRILIFLVVVIFILFANMWGIEQEEDMNYEKVKKKFTKLYQQKKYAEAVEMYEEALARFPENFYEITFALVQLYKNTGQYGKSLDMLELGLRKKVIYPIWAAADYWKPLNEHDPGRFKRILEDLQSLKKAKTAETAPQFDVFTPKKYVKEKKYPLLLVLHGWNESKAHLTRYWQAKRIDKDFLLAVVQSSQVVSPVSFGWDDGELGRKDVKTVYAAIAAAYPVDEKKIILAGFSQGGMMALDIAVSGVVPAAGFVILHPGGGVPGEFNAGAVTKARERGLKGTILVSEADKSKQELLEVKEVLDNTKFDYRFVVSGAGHWYPGDFPAQLQAAIAHIID